MIGLLFRLSSKPVGRGPALSGNVRGLLTVSGTELVLFALFFAAAWLVSRASCEQLLFPWRPGWWVVPLGIGYSIALRLVLFVVIGAVIVILAATRAATPEKVQQFVITNRPAVENLVSVSAMRSNPTYFWLMVTFVSLVVAGVREEVWRAGTLAAMRALWPRAFDSRGGQCLAISLIAVVFGLMHWRMGALAAVLAGVLGLLLGIIMVLHKSIWPAVIAHGLFDATNLALLPWWIDKVQHLR